MKKWNEGRFPTNPGEYSKIDIFDEPVVVDNGYSNVVPVELTVGLTVWEQLYFGQLPISQISGFKDEFSGKIITNAFTVGIVTPDELEKKWLRIKSEAELPMPAVLVMVGFVGCEMPQR